MIWIVLVLTSPFDGQPTCATDAAASRASSRTVRCPGYCPGTCLPAVEICPLLSGHTWKSLAGGWGSPVPGVPSKRCRREQPGVQCWSLPGGQIGTFAKPHPLTAWRSGQSLYSGYNSQPCQPCPPLKGFERFPASHSSLFFLSWWWIAKLGL